MTRLEYTLLKEFVHLILYGMEIGLKGGTPSYSRWSDARGQFVRKLADYGKECVPEKECVPTSK